MGYDENLVVPWDPREGGRDRAPRHRNGILSVSKAQQVLETEMLGVDESIRRALAGRLWGEADKNA